MPQSHTPLGVMSCPLDLLNLNLLFAIFRSLLTEQSPNPAVHAGYNYKVVHHEYDLVSGA